MQKLSNSTPHSHRGFRAVLRMAGVVFYFASALSLSQRAGAGRKIASIRSPASVPDGAKSPMNDKMWKSLNEAYVGQIVKTTGQLASKVKTPKDFERLYLNHLSEEDRANFLRELKGDFKPIQPRFDGDTMFFGKGENEVRVQWPNGIL